MKNKTAFCFDFDGTVTRQELLPLIAQELNLYEEVKLLTQLTLDGLIPFQSSFKLRVKLLSTVSTATVSNIARKVVLDESLCTFIRAHADQCFIVTGNLDVWVSAVIQEKLGCKVYSSIAEVDGDQLTGIKTILNKGDALRKISEQFSQTVAIGDSMNDCPMFEVADIGVAYGATHEPVNSLIKLSDYVIYQPEPLVRLLNNIKRNHEEQ